MMPKLHGFRRYTSAGRYPKNDMLDLRYNMKPTVFSFP